MTLDELLKRCHEESPIEKRLVENLYPELSPAIREKLETQHPIHLPPNTIPDFAFPRAKIAIYCDSCKWGRSALKCRVVKSVLRLAKSFIQQQDIHQRNLQ